MNITTDEGYIKFECNWTGRAIDIDDTIFQTIDNCRSQLFKLKLIGALDNGIGYGNISVRYGNENHFIITGSATGHLPELDKTHLALVLEYDIDKNQLNCTGQIKASSESLTHAALYELNENINAVIHVHSKDLWKKYLAVLPSTLASAEYGTPQMAREIQNCASKISKPSGIIVMAGHEDGIISYGQNIDEALEILLTYYNQSR